MTPSGLGTLALCHGRVVTVIAVRADGLWVVSYRVNRRVEVEVVEEAELIILEDVPA
jgi:hypothetical protein